MSVSKVRGIKVRRGMSYDKLEAEAEWVIERLTPGRLLDCPLPGIDLFEDMTTKPGEPPFRIPIGRDQSLGLGAAVTMIPDGQLARARFVQEEGSILLELSDLGYELLSKGHPRGLSTLYHELGHAFLHTAELIDLEYIEHARSSLARHGPSHQLFEDSEWQADSFAYAALAPLRLLKLLKREDRLSPVELAEITGISLESAAYRIDNATRKQGL